MRAPSLDPESRRLLLEMIDRAEAHIREQYFASWLKALNDPEGTRIKAQLIGECFGAIRGELNNV